MTANEIKSIVEEMASIRNLIRVAFFQRYPEPHCPPRNRWRFITARIANFIDDGDFGSPSVWLRDLRWLKEYKEVLHHG